MTKHELAKKLLSEPDMEIEYDIRKAHKCKWCQDVGFVWMGIDPDYCDTCNKNGERIKTFSGW